MTKRDIATRIAEETGVKQLVVQQIVQKTFDHIVAALARGETVELRNFGVFKVKARKGRIGRNPRTGDVVDVPPKKTAVFKPGRIMKDRVSN